MTRKVFRALGPSVVEKRFIDKDEPTPEGWRETQKAALAAWETTHAIEEPRAAENDAGSSPQPEVREEDGDPTERGSGVRPRRPEEGEEEALIPREPARRGPERHRRGR